MDNKILVGVGILFGIFLVFPFVAQQLKEKPAEETVASTGTTAAATKPVEMPSDPPLWNAMNIVGSSWKVDWEGRALKMTIMPNGMCHVFHPLMRNVAGKDFVEGQWRLDYDTAYIDIVFGTQEYHFALNIRGYTIYDPQGKPIEQIQ
jgi:hypothetical protein